MIKRHTDHVGKRYGRLVVLHDSLKRRHRGVVWACLCDCGEVCDVTQNALVSGRTKSCGCLSRDTRKALNKEQVGERHPLYNPEARRPRTGKKQKLRSVIVAETALGRALQIKPLGDPDGEIVHHINSNSLDNRNGNLLICTQSYHVGLHNKMRSKGYDKRTPIRT